MKWPPSLRVVAFLMSLPLVGTAAAIVPLGLRSRAAFQDAKASLTLLAEVRVLEKAIRSAVRGQFVAASRYLSFGNPQAWDEFTQLAWSLPATERRYLALPILQAEREALERARVEHRVFEGIAQGALLRRDSGSRIEDLPQMQVAFDRTIQAFDDVSRRLETRLASEIGTAGRAAEWIAASSAALAVLSLLSLALATSLAFRGVLDPIDALELAAARLGSGDLSARAPVAGIPAVALLGRRFNAMADDLQSLMHRLEDRVTERTHALETIQARLVEAERLAAVAEVNVALRHEINNPLAVLVGAAEILEAKPDDPDLVRRWAASMRDSAGRIAAVLRRLEELRRVETTDYTTGIPMVDLAADSEPIDPKQMS